jgi:hypothetical protein
MLQPVSAHDVVPRHRLIDIAPVVEPVVPQAHFLASRTGRIALLPKLLEHWTDH